MWAFSKKILSVINDAKLNEQGADLVHVEDHNEGTDAVGDVVTPVHQGPVDGGQN